MSTTTASFTTYNELQPYFADLGTLPRLSVQEEETLLCRLRLAQQGLLSAEQAQGVRHRLIERYLYRVIRLAKEQQSFFHRLSLADLIQEGNLGLLQAVENFDFTDPQGHFFAYATTYIRNAITRVLPRDGLLSIHRLQFWRLAQQDRLAASGDATLKGNSKARHIQGVHPVGERGETSTSSLLMKKRDL